MSHCHSHHHHPHHQHGRNVGGNRRRLALVLVLAAIYMVAEAVGGWLTGSLALLADAGHMLSDVAALALSFFAVWIADRPRDARRTYGYYRAEILAALANGATLVLVALLIFHEAWQRLASPPEVPGGAMMAIASGGLLVNLAGLAVLHGGRHGNLNVRGAWLHVLSDALGSLGAIAAGALIWALGWNWADPIASVLIGALVIYASWRLLQEAVAVLMESAPRGLDVDEIARALAELPGVTGVHDLHVWTITSGLDAISAHLVAGDHLPYTQLLYSARTMLHERFGIDHVTLQVEPEDFDERPCPV